MAKTCPKDLTLHTDEGNAKLTDNVTFGEENRIYFEARLPLCRDTPSVLLSAFGGDSFVILEILDRSFHLKMKAGNRTYSEKLNLYWTDIDLCDGKWHKCKFSI